MFSVVFPGQGSQKIGMCKELFDKYPIVKNLFNQADEILDIPISKIVFEGPNDLLNLTENTQPAIFLTSYAIYKIALEEFGLNLNDAKFIAGHSLGEYSALASYGAIDFKDCLLTLKKRGKSMQDAIPSGKGSMLAVLGSSLSIIDEILDKDFKNKCFVANDNSPQQVVVSGLKENIIKFSDILNKKKIKNVSLNVSAPFHCDLMKQATDNMKPVINNLKIENLKNELVSNVTALPTCSADEIKKLLVLQIESKVRWCESVSFMVNNGVNNFIEIGPGKVLSGLIKRINKNVKIQTLNNIEDIKNINLNV